MASTEARTESDAFYIHVKAPKHLRGALQRAADNEMTNVSTFVRQTLAKALAERGHLEAA